MSTQPSSPPPSICVIELAGGRPLYGSDVRAEVLAALLRSPFAPEQFSFESEAQLEPLDPAVVTESLPGPSGRWLMLTRKGAPACDVLLALGPRPALFLRSDCARSPGGPRALFELADALAEICQPALGWAHVARELEPPYLDEAARRRARMDEGVRGRFELDDRGPGGLGMRTYFGERALEQLSPEALHALPAPAQVVELPWGGVRVDLLPSPFAAAEVDLLGAFERAMGAVEPTGFFAAANVSAEGVRFEAPAWWRPDRFDPPREENEDEGGPPAGPEGLAELLSGAGGAKPLADLSLLRLAARGAHLERLRAERVALSFGDFTDTSWQGATLVDVDLDRTLLAGASFAKAHLDQVSFREAEGEGGRFVTARLYSCFFASARLPAADFREAQLKLPDLERAELVDARFDGATLEGAFFGDAVLTRASFAGAKLEDCEFTGADLAGADFSGARVVNCQFTGAQLGQVRWTGATLEGCSFDEGAAPRP
jgi:uncharacterized protein YjbI with pentapeptide repeats